MQKAQAQLKKRRVIPTLIAPSTSVTPSPERAAPAASAAAAAAPAPRLGTTSIATLVDASPKSNSPRKRKVEEDEASSPSSTQENHTPAAPAATVVHQPEVKKAKRKIAPSVVAPQQSS